MLESWSTDTLENVSGIVGTFIIWLGVFATLGGIAAFIMANEKDRRNRIESDQSAERIAELERGNLVIQDNIAENQRIAAEAGAKSDTLKLELATAEATITKLQIRLEELRLKQLPRTVTPELRQKLLVALSNRIKGPVKMASNPGNVEAKQYASELGGVMRDAGYITDWYNPLFTMFHEGAFVFIKSKSKAPHHVIGILDAFGDCGIFLVLAESSDITDDNLVVLGISEKPLDPISMVNKPRNFVDLHQIEWEIVNGVMKIK